MQGTGKQEEEGNELAKHKEEKVWEGDREKETKTGREERMQRGGGEAVADSQSWQVLDTQQGPILS